MRALCITLGALCLLSATVSAGDVLAPRSKEAIHFRLEVGVEPGHIVAGWLDTRGESKDGFDCAVLDLDEDGTAETVQMFPMVKDPRTGIEVPHQKVTVRHEDADWELDLRYSRFQPAEGTTSAQAHIRWSVRKDEFYAWFINGRVTFHTTAAAAADAAPVRMGPPFTFQTGSRTRGPDALVQVGLKDSNGCTMRLARVAGTERKIRVHLFEGKESRFETWAAYG